MKKRIAEILNIKTLLLQSKTAFIQWNSSVKDSRNRERDMDFGTCFFDAAQRFYWEYSFEVSEACLLGLFYSILIYSN